MGPHRSNLFSCSPHLRDGCFSPGALAKDGIPAEAVAPLGPAVVRVAGPGRALAPRSLGHLADGASRSARRCRRCRRRAQGHCQGGSQPRTDSKRPRHMVGSGVAGRPCACNHLHVCIMCSLWEGVLARCISRACMTLDGAEPACQARLGRDPARGNVVRRGARRLAGYNYIVVYQLTWPRTHVGDSPRQSDDEAARGHDHHDHHARTRGGNVRRLRPRGGGGGGGARGPAPHLGGGPERRRARMGPAVVGACAGRPRRPVAARRRHGGLAPRGGVVVHRRRLPGGRRRVQRLGPLVLGQPAARRRRALRGAVGVPQRVRAGAGARAALCAADARRVGAGRRLPQRAARRRRGAAERFVRRAHLRRDGAGGGAQRPRRRRPPGRLCARPGPGLRRLEPAGAGQRDGRVARRGGAADGARGHGPRRRVD